MPVQRPGWGIAVCGSCSVVGLRWWAGVCCVRLWWFPALVLVHAFITIASLCNTQFETSYACLTITSLCNINRLETAAGRLGQNVLRSWLRPVDRGGCLGAASCNMCRVSWLDACAAPCLGALAFPLCVYAFGVSCFSFWLPLHA